jgi:hypothetical protein
MCYSDYTRIINTIIWYRTAITYLLRLGMQGIPPIPPQIGIIAGFEFVGRVIESGSQ